MEAQEKLDQSDLPPVSVESGAAQGQSSHEKTQAKAAETPQSTPIAHPLFADDSTSGTTGQDDNTPPHDDDADLPLDIDVPAEAEDIDLIEKAWVTKAKEIVDNTLGDPYKQNKQISQIKADYIKKRYNKDIKPSKEQQ